MHDEALSVLPQVVDRLGLEAPVLLGHSDGASIALIYAGATARPVGGLVCLAPHVFVEELAERDARRALCTMCVGVGQGIAALLERA